MGALIGGASSEEADLLYKFGYDVGLAFQITDDWLDTFGDPKVFGKAIGGDILNNKKTWLMIKAQNNASAAELEALAKAMEMPVGTEEEKAAKIAAVKDLYAQLGVEQQAKEEIVRLHNQAMESVEKLGLTTEKKEALIHYAETLLGRKK